MKHLLKVVVASVAVATLAGCATPKEYVQPTKTPLQDPMPGQSLVYLLRSPYDGTNLAVQVNGRKVADLPSSRYTIISLKPGRYTLASVYTDFFNNGKEAVPPFQLEVAAEQRYFVNLPALERRTETGLAGVVPIGKAGAVPLILPQTTESSAVRTWAIVPERDAQWFMFYTKPILPERDAL